MPEDLTGLQSRTDRERPPVFHEETVDVSRKYGLGILLAAGVVQAANHFASPETAVNFATITLAVVGLGFVLQSGKRIVQIRTTEVSDDE